jgi:hypothetical protein
MADTGDNTKEDHANDEAHHDDALELVEAGDVAVEEHRGCR